MSKPLTSDIIQRISNYVDSEVRDDLWSGKMAMWDSRDDFFHFKLMQWKQKLIQDCMYYIMYGGYRIEDLKTKLAQATEIIEFLELVGYDQGKSKKKMDEAFGLYLMRSPEVKRWD